MRKNRSDAKLLNLPEAQQAQLAEWLLGGMPYHVAAAQVDKEFGVKAGKSAFEGFWYSVCAPALVNRRRRAVQAAEVLDEEIKKSGAFDKVFGEQLKQLAFEITLEPNVDPQKVFFVISQALKLRDQELKAEQIKLAKDKFQFDAATACLKKLPALKQVSGNASLDERAKIDQIREILFGEDLPT